MCFFPCLFLFCLSRLASAACLPSFHAAMFFCLSICFFIFAFCRTENKMRHKAMMTSRHEERKRASATSARRFSVFRAAQLCFCLFRRHAAAASCRHACRLLPLPARCRLLEGCLMTFTLTIARCVACPAPCVAACLFGSGSGKEKRTPPSHAMPACQHAVLFCPLV